MSLALSSEYSGSHQSIGSDSITLAPSLDQSGITSATGSKRSINTYVLSTSSTANPIRGFPLQRFIGRAILLILVPPLITAYFIVLCNFYRVPNPDTNSYGHRNALCVYYSWFIIGVFGLGISKYGLSGIEAAMLQDRQWHAKNAMALLMHSCHSWSGPGGWIKCLGILLRKRKLLPAPRLWWLLSLLSLMVTLALPLSGLSLELCDGFVKDPSQSPLMIGYSSETFNSRNTFSSAQEAWGRWRLNGGSSIRLPGAGVAYTPKGLDRCNYDYLKDIPNSMSAVQDVPDLFLIPQATYPSSGSAWGVRLSYNCSVVRYATQFTILPKRSSLSVNNWTFPDSVNMGTGPPSIAGVTVYNTTTANLFAYVELGATYDTDYTKERQTEPDILEFAMWQIRARTYSSNDLNYTFNSTITTPISGLGWPVIQHANGSFTPNTTFLRVQESPEHNVTWDGLQKFVANGKTLEYDQPFLELAPSPIGARCQAWSETGTATINPEDLSYSNFIRVPPAKADPRLGDQYGALPFGRTVWSHFHKHRKTAFTNLLDSINFPPPALVNTSEAYPYYFQAEYLRISLMRAYAIDALKLMYNGCESFVQTEQTKTHIRTFDTLTASRPGKILVPGTVPDSLPTVLFAIWAVGCVSLGLAYGFRLRWTETLDGYSFLRFGADYAREINGGDGDGDGAGLMSHGAEFHRNEKLGRLPGLVGDVWGEREVGRISLVGGGRVAQRDRLYV
ncbi:hypothetical protein BJY04DRAFT_212728 [Aspergillus karnatakaensis]|uniref:uncharacterized protein n=1 Tax=Aspergillus karnatakaensis TaxID=1810916 RepID=UPI003CCD4C3C